MKLKYPVQFFLGLFCFMVGITIPVIFKFCEMVAPAWLTVEAILLTCIGWTCFLLIGGIGLMGNAIDS